MTDVILEQLRGEVSEIARHEAAHLVVARSLGFKTGEVRVVANLGGFADGGSSIELDRRLPALEDVRVYLRDRLAVLYAGAMAETVLMGDVDREAAYRNLETCSKDDFSKIRELLKVLAGIERKDGEEAQDALTRVENEVWDYTRTLVLRFDNEIEQLANTLRHEVRAPGVPAVVHGWDQPDLGAGLEAPSVSTEDA